jgi:hypothetical protein
MSIVVIVIFWFFIGLFLGGAETAGISPASSSKNVMLIGVQTTTDNADGFLHGVLWSAAA